jgi:hypothetical protein
VEEKIELTIRMINDWKRTMLIFISISVLLFISSIIAHLLFPDVKVSDHSLSVFIAGVGVIILLAGCFTVYDALRKHPLKLILDDEKFEYVYFFKNTKKIKEMRWRDIRIIKPNNRLVDINSNEIKIHYLTTDQLKVFMELLEKIRFRYPRINSILIELEREPEISVTIPGKGKRSIIVDQEGIQYIMKKKYIFSIKWSEINYLEIKQGYHYNRLFDDLYFYLSNEEKEIISGDYFQRVEFKKMMNALNQYAYYHKIEWK